MIRRTREHVPTCRRKTAAQLAAGLCVLLAGLAPLYASSLPSPTELNTGWQLQDSAKLQDGGAVVSTKNYQPQGWNAATVPGTVLTSLVNDAIYPEPLYGENNRPDRIPESLNKTSYWYRTVFTVPAAFRHQFVMLHFDGVNFGSEIWVNGAQVGSIRGAFIRGRFDITKLVKPGETAVLAVKVSPQPHPGVPHEHTIANGTGGNGGITAMDGPTFLSTIGWDWLPAIRDRDTGVWQKVWLSASGPVLIEDPLVTTDLPLPRTDSANVTVKTTLRNFTGKKRKAFSKAALAMCILRRRSLCRRTARKRSPLIQRQPQPCTWPIPSSGGQTIMARRTSTLCILHSYRAGASPM